MANITFIYSGTKWQYDLYHSAKYSSKITKIIHACTLPEEDLKDIDVIIVPRESNQEMLLKARDKLEVFLAQGKTLVSFGEISVPWLPDAKWIPKYAKFDYEDAINWDKGRLYVEPYRITSPDHPLLKGLELEDLEWHFHGAFQAPKTAEVLLKYGDDADIIYIDSRKYKGNILATTLDPAVHAGYGVIKKTQRFLDNVLDWVENYS